MSTLRFEVSDPRFELGGIRHVTVRSPALGRRADLSTAGGGIGRPRAVVLLLHGVYGSHLSWLHQGAAHETLERLTAAATIPPMLLVTPSDGLWGEGSGYLSMAEADHERWIVEEVPTVAQQVHDVDATVPLFLAGFSMGGYGALRLAGRHRERFAGASAHSAITRLADHAAFGDATPAGLGVDEPDVVDCLTAAGRPPTPPLRFDCGRDDDLIEANRELHRRLVAAGTAHSFEEYGGGHNWTYWGRQLTRTLRFAAAHI